MTRIEGVPVKGHPLIRLVYGIARREVRRMTGKPLLTPDVPLRAHRLLLLAGYGALEKSVATRPRVPQRLRALAALKSAVMQGCEMCQDIGSFEARAHGVVERQLVELHRYRESEHFDELERLVLDLAVGMTVTPVQVSDELIEALREHFDDAQLVELVNLVAVENLRSRFNGAFALGAAGFSEGMACARMEPASTASAAGTAATVSNTRNAAPAPPVAPTPERPETVASSA
jgi:4-carboxymuconolactone decarboxylase